MLEAIRSFGVLFFDGSLEAWCRTIDVLLFISHPHDGNVEARTEQRQTAASYRLPLGERDHLAA